MAGSLPTAPGESAGVPDADFPLDRLGWIDAFFAQVQEHLCIRPADAVLILPPSQVLRLNAGGLRVLEHLGRGLPVADLPGLQPGARARQVHDFMSDLRDLYVGDARGLDQRPAVELVPYGFDFTRLPVLGEIALTYRCNNRCRFCYAGCGGDDGPATPSAGAGGDGREMTTVEVQRVIRLFRETAQLPFFSFTGGEPLLRADLEELIRFARGQGLAVNLITNGTLATPARARRLAAAGLPTAQVSLEAPDEELHDLLTGRRGAFRETLAGIASLQQAGIEVQTNTTITRPSADRIAALPAFLAGLGVRRCSLNLCIPTGTARTAADLLLPYQEVGPLLEEVRRAARTAGIGLLWYSPTPHCLYNPIARGFGNKSCAAMDGLLSVSPQGDVLPCSSYPQPLGNLLREEFSTIWFSAAARFFKEKRHAPAECQGCASFVACQGACPLYWQAVGTAELAGRRRAPSGGAAPGPARVPGPGGWVAAPAATS